jgi:hypothetical protein
MDDGKYAVMPYLDDIACCIDGGDFWITTDEQPDGDSNEQPDMCFSGSTEGYTRIKRWCPKLGSYYDKSSFQKVRVLRKSGPTLPCTLRLLLRGGQGVLTLDHKVMLACGSHVCKEWFETNGAICEVTGSKIRKSEVVEFEGKKVSTRYKRKIEIERQDEMYRAERAANRERTMRFYDAVQPMLNASIRDNDDWYRNDEDMRRRDRYYREMTRRQELTLRDLVLTSRTFDTGDYLDERTIQVDLDGNRIAPDRIRSAEQTVDHRGHRYETIRTIDGQTISRRVA